MFPQYFVHSRNNIFSKLKLDLTYYKNWSNALSASKLNLLADFSNFSTNAVRLFLELIDE